MANRASADSQTKPPRVINSSGKIEQMTTDAAGDGSLASASQTRAQPTDATLLQTFLADRDTACPRCRYNLRNLSGSRCPECGDELLLRIGITEPRQTGAIAGLIALSAGAGLNGLLLGYYLINMARLRDMGEPAFLWVNVGGFLVQGAALAAWLKFWRRIHRRSRVGKALLLTGCWLLVLANLVIFSWLVD
jgi:hypothetical protein